MTQALVGGGLAMYAVSCLFAIRAYYPNPLRSRSRRSLDLLVAMTAFFVGLLMILVGRSIRTEEGP